jgi:hypothetical protein
MWGDHDDSSALQLSDTSVLLCTGNELPLQWRVKSHTSRKRGHNARGTRAIGITRWAADDPEDMLQRTASRALYFLMNFVASLVLFTISRYKQLHH